MNQQCMSCVSDLFLKSMTGQKYRHALAATLRWLLPQEEKIISVKCLFLTAARSFSLRCAGLLLPAPSPLLLHYLLPAILGSSQINGGHPLVLDCAQLIYFGTPLSKHRENFFELLRCMFFFYCLLDHILENKEKKSPIFFCNFCTIKPCLHVSVFLYFFLQAPLFGPQYTLSCPSVPFFSFRQQKTVVLWGSLLVCGDWIVLFGYVTGFKTVLPLRGKDMFSCVYSVPLAVLHLRFYWSHVVWKVFK